MQNLRKNWLFYTLVLASVLLIASAVLRILTPPQIVVPRSTQLGHDFNNKPTSFQNITFTGTAPAVPPEFTIYSAQPSQQLVEQQVVNQIIQKYQLKPLTNSTDTWTSSAYYLSKDQYRHFYTLGQNQPSLSLTAIVQKDVAIQKAQSILQELFPGNLLQVIPSGIVYESAGVEPSVVAPEAAKLIFIPFAYQLDGYPTFYQNQSEFPFGLNINSSYELQQLFFYPQFIQPQPLQKKNSISIQQAVTNMNNNQASLVNSQSDLLKPLNTGQILSATLSKVSIEYRVDDTTHLAIPYYRFSGTGTDANQSPMTLEIVTPAVQTGP